MALSAMDTTIKILESKPEITANGVGIEKYNVLAEVKAAMNHKLKASYLSSSGGWINDTAIAPFFQTATFRRIPHLKITTEHYVEVDGERFRILGLRTHHKMYVECQLATVTNAKGAAYGAGQGTSTA